MAKPCSPKMLAHLARLAEANKGRSPSPETRALLSAATKGKKKGPMLWATRLKIGAANRGKSRGKGECSEKKRAHLENLAIANRGRKQSPETRAKIALATSKAMTEEIRAKIGAAHKGKTLSPEHRAAIIAENTGRKHTPEAIEKMRASHRAYAESLRGKKQSPEHIANAIAGRAHLLGVPLSPEHRAKISVAMTAPRSMSGQRYQPLRVDTSGRAANRMARQSSVVTSSRLVGRSSFG
jgi:hypothetical protein